MLVDNVPGMRVPPRTQRQRARMTRSFRVCVVRLCAASLICGAQTPVSRGDPELMTDGTRSAVNRGLQFLAERQNRDNGSFGSGRYAGNVAVTSLSAMAFLAGGHVPGRGTYGGQIGQAVRFILSRARPSGLIVSENPEAIDRAMYDHGFATLLLAEVHGMWPKSELRKTLSQAVRLIVETQNDEGGWRYRPERNAADVSVTVCQLVALRAAHNAGLAVPERTIERGAEYIRRCRMPDGGFRYQIRDGTDSLFSRTAAAIVGLQCCGVNDDGITKQGLAFLTAHRPKSPDAEFFFYGHYYAVQAWWRAGDQARSKWYTTIRDDLLTLQDEDLASGAWLHPDICHEYATAMACLVLQLPNNYLPIFER